MEGRINYTVVGVFLIGLCALLFAGILWMSSFDNGKMYQGYAVYMHEDVTGLNTDAPVRFNGVKVGYVESMRLDAKNSKLVRLILRIEPNVPITTSTYAILVPQGVTGVVTVNLHATTETAPPLIAQKGEEYAVIPSHPSVLTQVSAVLPALATDFQKVSNSVSQALDQQNLDSLRASLTNIAKITKTLADSSNDISESLRSLNHASANIAKTSDQLPQTMTTFDQTLKSSQLLVHTFSNQVLPGMQQAMNNLTVTTQNINQITEELQRNPSMLIRGKQPAPLGPGEK